MKNLLTLLVMMLFPVAVLADDSGSCGIMANVYKTMQS